MSGPKKIRILFFSVFLIVLVLTGCSWKWPANFFGNSTNSPSETNNKSQQNDGLNSNSLIQLPDQSDYSEYKSNIQPNATEKTTPNHASQNENPINTLKPFSNERFNPNDPTLMGLRIGDLAEKFIEQWGQGNDILRVDDPDSPYTVYSFPGISIGVDMNRTLMFISIDSAEIDTGLGGVKVGQKIEEAIQLLGPPSTNSKFVVSYRTNTTILKLDVDPERNIILSIKLFNV
jgi:hypothetical protein